MSAPLLATVELSSRTESRPKRLFKTSMAATESAELGVAIPAVVLLELDRAAARGEPNILFF